MADCGQRGIQPVYIVKTHKVGIYFMLGDKESVRRTDRWP